MKRIIILILLISSPVLAGPYAKIEIGKPFMSNPDCANEMYWTYMQIGYRHYISDFTFDIWGGTETWAWQNGVCGNPWRETYNVGIKFKYKFVYIETGHFCSHHFSTGIRYLPDNYKTDRYLWNQRSNHVKIGAEFEYK